MNTGSATARTTRSKWRSTPKGSEVSIPRQVQPEPRHEPGEQTDDAEGHRRPEQRAQAIARGGQADHGGEAQPPGAGPPADGLLGSHLSRDRPTPAPALPSTPTDAKTRTASYGRSSNRSWPSVRGSDPSLYRRFGAHSLETRRPPDGPPRRRRRPEPLP